VGFLERFSKKPTNQELVTRVGELIFPASIAAEKEILRSWATVDTAGKESDPTKTSWAIRTEMVFFLIHLMDRMAFAKGGPQLRDMLVDSIAPSVLQATVAGTWQPPPGHDPQNVHAHIFDELTSDMNKATDEYSALPQLMSEGGFPTTESTVFGRLTLRIARELGIPHDIDFRLAVFAAAPQALIASDLNNRIQQLCAALK